MGLVFFILIVISCYFLLIYKELGEELESYDIVLSLSSLFLDDSFIFFLFDISFSELFFAFEL